MENSIYNISNILGISDLSENILDALTYFVFLTDKNGNIIYINKAGMKLLREIQYTPSGSVYELLDKYEMFLEDGKKLNLKNSPLYNTLIYKKEIRNLILKCNLDKSIYYISISTYPLIKGNSAAGCIVTIKDITEKYLQELKIKNEREKFLDLSTELKTKCDIIEILRNREKEHLMYLKDVINNISEGILVLDNNEKLSLCNKSVFKILELKAIELVNPKKIIEKYEATIMENKEQDLKEVYNFYIEGKRPIKNKIVKLKDKASLEIKYIEVNSAPIVNKNNELIHTILTIKDVTETILHQINSEEQANFIKDVVNTVDVPIAVMDYPSMTYRLTNKKYEEIIEHNIYTDLNNIYLTKQKHMNNNLYQVLIDVGEKCKEHTITPYRVKDYKGDNRFYKIKFVPYKNKYNTIRIHVYGSDITDEFNHNIELEKITQLKDEFFTITSHELRTPLTIIYSSLQLAYDVYGKEITPNINKTLSRISQNCSRLLKLINNILDISKAEAGFLTLNSTDFDVVYVSEAIANSANSYATSKGIELIFDTNEEECNIRLDKDKYEKILLNLLSNAVKFTPEGKQIIVSLKIEEEYFYLSVKDFGVGIPEDKISLIFDRFAQVDSSLSRRAEGTGIGLALVKKIVNLMDGEITVESKLGEGTEFMVKFKRENVEMNHKNNYAILTENIDDRIDIEFSDIN